MRPIFGTPGGGKEDLEAFRRRTKDGMRQTEQAREAARSAMNRLLYELSEMNRKIHGDWEARDHDHDNPDA